MPTPTTPNRGYQMPHEANKLNQDVLRVKAALTAIDADMDAVMDAATALDGRVVTAEADIDALQAGAVMKTGDQLIAGEKTFSTSPVIPSPTAGDNSFKAATTAFVANAVAAAVAAAVATKRPGDVVQVVNTQTGAVANTTTVMPFDDTVPQITEGAEFMTRTITPTSATNKLRIDVVFNGSCSTTSYITVALFKDAAANALAVGSKYGANGTYEQVVFTFFMDAGTTSATTFRVRAGQHTGGTLTMNGDGGARRLAGILFSSITVTEIQT